MAVLLFVYTTFCACRTRYRQYNVHAVSNILNIIIDEKQMRKYVGEPEGQRICAEGLQIDSLYFTAVKSERISLLKAIETERTSTMTEKEGHGKQECS